ncbi:MAG: hypothetical protein QFX32_07885 [Methanolinea sp.]|nr:hypothetical protein [Methanolinea sp.]
MGTESENHGHVFFLRILFAISLLVPAASALSVTVTPDRIGAGDTVTIAVTDLADNSTFALRVDGAFPVGADGKFTFRVENLVLPFALRDGTLSATLRNTETNVLTVQKGDTEVKKVGTSRDGVFTTSDSGSIPAGTYEVISLEGTAAPGATMVVAALTLEGKKSGPADSVITFVVAGIPQGTVTVTVTVDGAMALSRTYALGGQPATTATTPATSPTTSPATTVATATPTPTPLPAGGGGGGGGGGTASIGIPGTTTATVTATPAVTESPHANISQPVPPETAVTVTETEPATTPPPPTRSPSFPLAAALALALVAIATRKVP